MHLLLLIMKEDDQESDTGSAVGWGKKEELQSQIVRPFAPGTTLHTHTHTYPPLLVIRRESVCGEQAPNSYVFRFPHLTLTLAPR